MKSCFTHPVSAVVDGVMCSRSYSGYRPRVVTTNIASRALTSHLIELSRKANSARPAGANRYPVGVGSDAAQMPRARRLSARARAGARYAGVELRTGARLPFRAINLANQEVSPMSHAKRPSMRKRRGKAMPVLGAAGLLALASGASAETPATTPNT